MKIHIKQCIFLPSLLCLFFLLLVSIQFSYADVTPTPTPSDTLTPTPTTDPSQDKLNQLQQQINDLQNKVNDLQGQDKTLSSQIAVMDNQITITELRMNATEQEITNLTNDIEIATKKVSTLESSLNELVKVLMNRVVATYERGSTQPLQVLLSSGSASDAFIRANYLRIAQDHDKQLIYETQQAKNDYVNQKTIFEEKKKKVESLKAQLLTYKTQLDQEKKDKQVLLEVTRNNEATYQQQLRTALAERDAIAQIAAGGGNEVYIKDINDGEIVAHVISGSSPCSSGTHLHFEVHQNGGVQNPATYLSNKSVIFANSPDSSFSLSGLWSWPLEDQILITQGYGHTAWSNVYYGGGIHTGIDMFSDTSDSVHAVKAGKLYRGSVSCAGGLLLYSKVTQDSGIDTLYLHTLP